MTSVIRVTFLFGRENDRVFLASIKEFLSKCVRITWKVFKGGAWWRSEYEEHINASFVKRAV